jgi:predicted O-methyltransferase YrrM
LAEPRTSVQARDVELVFRQGGTPPPSSDQVIHVHKPPAFIAKIDALLQPVAPRRMAEVGVFHGGSTIYWQWQYDLDLLIAFEKEAAAPPLTNYLHRNGLSDRVRVHFGVSQDDTARIRAALLHELGAELLDVVNDDASHQYAETRSTVETLLPFVRAGGVYIIEDWAWGHRSTWPPEAWADAPLMSPLLSELMLVCGHATGVIEKMEINPYFATLWRGDQELRRDGSFRLTDHYTPRGFSVAL